MLGELVNVGYMKPRLSPDMVGEFPSFIPIYLWRGSFVVYIKISITNTINNIYIYHIYIYIYIYEQDFINHIPAFQAIRIATPILTIIPVRENSEVVIIHPSLWHNHSVIRQLTRLMKTSYNPSP